MKKGDIVKFKLDKDKEVQGSVNWTDGANAGITMLGKKFHFANEYIVMPVEDCEVVTEHKGVKLKEQIHKMDTEDLKDAIQRLKGMRFPKRMTRRTRSTSATPSKRQRMTKLLEVLDGDPDALDGLIEKALKEDKG